MSGFVIWLLGSFISTLGFSYMYYKFSDVKKRLSNWSYVIFYLGVLGITFIKYYDLKSISFIVFFLFYPILFYSMNNIGIKKLIYYVIVIWLYGMAIDLLLMVIISFLHKYLSLNILDYYSLASVQLSIVVCLLLILIARSKHFKRITELFYKWLNNIKYSSLALISFTIFVFIAAYVILSSLPNLTMGVLLTLLIILIVVTFIFLIKYKINEEENIEYLNFLKKNNKFYMQMEEENRIFKHNLIAKFLSIKSVANNRSKLLIDDMVEQFGNDIKKSSQIKMIPYGIQGIIYEKIHSVMGTIDIKVINEIDYDIFDVLNPLRYNVFMEKMIICLDNAIEASLNSEKKILFILLYETDNEIIMEIRNTFKGKIDLDNLGMMNYSTKGKKRGIGLFSILRNNEANLKIKLENDMFVSKIIVKKRSYR